MPVNTKTGIVLNENSTMFRELRPIDRAYAKEGHQEGELLAFWNLVQQ